MLRITAVASDPLIDRAQRGDTSAIGEIYELYVDRIFRYVSYRVPTLADCEDITVDVFVKMVEGLANYRNMGVPFEAWLYRIASARIVDYRRHAMRHPQTALDESLVDKSDEQPEDVMVEKQDLEALREAVSRLTEDQQTLLVLRFVERYSHKQVAEIMGKSVTAVKTIQHRALSLLAEELGETKVRHYLRGDSSE